MWKTDITDNASFTNTVLIEILLMWQIVDVYTTNYLMLQGVAELNPIINWLTGVFGILGGLIIAKLIFITPMVYLIQKVIHRAFFIPILTVIVLIYSNVMLLCNIPMFMWYRSGIDFIPSPYYIWSINSSHVIIILIYIFMDIGIKEKKEKFIDK